MVKKLKTKQNKKRRKRSDIKAIKKAIKNELYTQYIFPETRNSNNKIEKRNSILSKDEFEIYNYKYRQYLKEEFNSSIANMIVSYITKNKSFPLKYKKEINFVNKMINLLKHLLMNEFEIAFFTILLDKLGWIYQNMDHWTYFCLLGIYTKKLADNEDDSSLLIDLISRDNPYFMDLYINWICDDNIMKKIEENEISVLLINERYKELTAQTNYFCQKNFINFNGIVDKISYLT
jgi:hypothetical protein